jgi:TonB family protein
MNTVIRSLLLSLSICGASACAQEALMPSQLATQLPTGLIGYERPEYPLELKGTSITDGYTTIAFVVRADGAIDDAVVMEASHPAFGEAVMDVLPVWRFERTASALPRREVIRFVFRQTDAVMSLSHRDATKAAFPLDHEERLPIRTVQWMQLASPPERLASPAPQPPARGKVAVSYIIDTTGKVRVPAVVNATQPELGLAALAAVKQWQFAPPMHDGMPVLVEDTRSFTFGK